MKTRQNQDFQNHQARVTRRELFGKSATGLGTAALASLLGKDSLLAASPGSNIGNGQPPLPGLPHHLPTAKRVVVLWQVVGQSGQGRLTISDVR
ncbi:MAG: hypothetical protein ACKO9Q_11045, partial [Pirellula sp.]